MKRWYESKTLWFNVAAGLVLLAEYLQTIDLGETAMHVVGGVLVVGNFALRRMTSEPVRFRGPGMVRRR